MQDPHVLKSPRLSELKKARHRTAYKKIIVYLFAIVAAFSLLVYGSNFDRLNIEKIDVTGNKVADSQEIQMTAQEKMSGKYLWLFPKTNILYYPQGALSAKLLQKFKGLKEVSFSIGGVTSETGRILHISVTERDAKYLWCNMLSSSSASRSKTDANDQKCYFLDENGYIFDKAPYFSGDVYFKFYGSTNVKGEPEGDPLGTYFFDGRFAKLISFRDELIALGLEPVELNITAEGDLEFILSSGSDIINRPKIILSSDSDFQNAAENLQAALSTEPLMSKFKKKYASLQYIDLRFGNKVYDKFL